MFMSYVVSRMSYVVSLSRSGRTARSVDDMRCARGGGLVLVGVLWLKIVLIAIVAII